MEWIEALSDAELDQLEELYRRHVEAGSTPSDAERLRAFSIHAAATSHMVTT